MGHGGSEGAVGRYRARRSKLLDVVVREGFHIPDRHAHSRVEMLPNEGNKLRFLLPERARDQLQLNLANRRLHGLEAINAESLCKVL